MISTILRNFILAFALFGLVSCQAAQRAEEAPSTAASPAPSEQPRAEVRGFLLGNDEGIPKAAPAFALPVLRDRVHAKALCDALNSRVDLNTPITTTTPMRTAEGKRIVPLAWMLNVTTAEIAASGGADGGRALESCDTLAAAYDMARAERVREMAKTVLARAGQNPASLDDTGPFMIAATRDWSNVVVYDMSQAPQVDYQKWVDDLIKDLEALEVRQGTNVVEAGVRDRVRFFVFKTVPYVQSAMAAVL
jgi:hypothetical protein